MASSDAANWEMRPFSQWGQWLSGGTPSKSREDYWGGYIPWVSSRDLYVRYVRDAGLQVTETGATNGTRLVEPGALLVVVRSMALANGLMAGLTVRKVAFNQDVKAIVPNDDVDPRFLLFAFWGHEREIRNLIDEASHGTKRLATERLGGFEMPLPPLCEQRKIVAVLGALDTKIEHELALSERLHRVAATYFREVFSKSSERVALAEVASIHKAAVKPGDDPKQLFEHYSIPAFDDGMLPDLEYGETMLSGKTRLPKSDCVLFSKLNPRTPRIWWPAPEGVNEAVCSPEFVVLTPALGVPPSFVYSAVRDDTPFQHEVQGRATGTTGSRQRIRPDDLLQCRVPAPAAPQLAAWEGFSTPLYRRAQVALASVVRLRAVRDELMPKLVKGQLEVDATLVPEALALAEV